MKTKILIIFTITTFALAAEDVVKFNLDVRHEAVSPIRDASKMILNRIYGGKPAAPGQFPWQVGLYITKSDGNYICGGSLLNQAWVLTAAHCTTGAKQILVRLGSNDFNSGIPIYADKFIQHVGYDPNTLENDISFIHMAANVALSSNVQPIRVPTYSQATTTFENYKAQVSGYGAAQINGAWSPTLNYANVTIISNANCASVYVPGLVTDNTICATGDGSSQGSCSGDSGGPLVINESGTYTLIGIVSFGSSGGCAAAPSGYLRTQKYLQMIANNAGVTIQP